MRPSAKVRTMKSVGPQIGAVQGVRRPRRRYWLLGLLGVPTLIAGLCLWFTTPLKVESPVAKVERQVTVLKPVPPPAPPPAVVEPKRLEWPKDTLAGPEAKRLLLDILIADDAKLRDVAGYTATFKKRERVKGKLGPEQTMELKVRHQPFSIYLKFLAPKAGKEVVYAEGKNDNKLMAHNGDWTRRLIPRLSVLPTDPLALADCRHPVTEAGLANLTTRLLGYRKLDLDDPEAITILDRVTDDQGREWLRSVHDHPSYHSDRPFKRVEVLYDPETFLPRKITSHDWPKPGHTGDLELAESYEYGDLKLDAPLTELDFDPANPAYAFTRY